MAAAISGGPFAAHTHTPALFSGQSAAMRKTAIAAAGLGVLWLAYVVWPFASLYGVVRAAQSGDAAAVAQESTRRRCAARSPRS